MATIDPPVKLHAEETSVDVKQLNQTSVDVATPGFFTSIRRSLVFQLLILLILWLAYGVAFALHWFYLLLNSTLEQRNSIVIHLVVIYAGTILTALGGGWCQTGDNYTECPGGESMSRTCLWETQTVEYQIIYTLHYVSLGWNGAHWIVDFCHLWRWARELNAGSVLGEDSTSVRLTALGFFDSPYDQTATLQHRLTEYWVILSISVILVTPTWTLLVDWNTEDGLGWLAMVLIVEIVLVMLVVDKYWTQSEACAGNLNTPTINTPCSNTEERAPGAGNIPPSQPLTLASAGTG